ncbi:MAG: hypothetical protein GWP10_08905, partial [Nitrospiraceae bacterium]|nr:hypothetical protein [Nitrospiraceae bacterium]
IFTGDKFTRDKEFDDFIEVIKKNINVKKINTKNLKDYLSEFYNNFARSPNITHASERGIYTERNDMYKLIICKGEHKLKEKEDK